jgi:tetratricopeptide (TPR) repeat protein
MKYDEFKTEIVKIDDVEKINQLFKLIDPNFILQAKNYYAKILGKKGRNDESLDLLNEVIVQSRENKDIKQEINALIDQANTFVSLTQSGEAAISLLQAEDLLHEFIISKRMINKDKIVKKFTCSISTINGLISQNQGQLSEALNYYNSSLKISSDINNLEGVAQNLTNISVVYQIKGEIDKALVYNVKALSATEKLDNIALKGEIYHDIAITYKSKGEFDKALDYYLKSLTIHNKLDYRDKLVETLFDLIILTVELEDFQLAEKYLLQMERINTTKPSRLTNLKYKLAKATIYKSSKRLVPKAKAFNIFKQIIISDIVVHDLTIFAIVSLCELLIDEFKIVKKEEILKEVKSYLDILLSIAKSQNSVPTLTETYILLYKLELISSNLALAQEYLSMAEVIVMENNLSRLEIKVSLEQDYLMEKMEIYEKLFNKNLPVHEMIKEMNLHNTLETFLKKRELEDDLRYTEDDPIFLFIINNTGITLYSKNFTQDIVFNQKLIGSYLMASSHGLSSAIRETKGSIERIKYGDYILLFKTVDEIMFCYAFKGSSYPAIQRLNRFLEEIKGISVWKQLAKKLPQPKIIESALEDVITRFFGKNL